MVAVMPQTEILARGSSHRRRLGSAGRATCHERQRPKDERAVDGTDLLRPAAAANCRWGSRGVGGVFQIARSPHVH